AWRWTSFGSFTPEDIDGQLCTHIVYAFATLDAETFPLNIDDSVDVYKSFLNKATEVRKRNGFKVYFGLGGWNDSKDDKYSRLASSSRSNRRNFVGYIIRIIEQNGFDGLDLDWEFPVCWQGDCSRSLQQDSENFIGLLEDLSEAFTSQVLLLSIAVSASKIVVNRGYTRISLLVRHVDWIAVSYDMYYIFMTFR
ncbi:probable chitinase 10, partial [Temnothorax curvispinosus]|uniref:Probable chitinase 10 n=1 Tax=Temnothorax curvispinosus TaxID=300111 RepID=A0A6J1REJ5_9HYME